MKITRRLALLSLLLLPVSCQTGPGLREPTPVSELALWMTGSFSSQAQALEQPDDYFDIRLFMEPIWTDRTDGRWLYVEQAAAWALERPYRQRVYHLVDTKDGPRSEVYSLPGDPLEFAGAYKEPQRFKALSPADLQEREGCAIHLRLVAGAYEGSTIGTGCTSSLGGASYATSEVVITQDTISSWDRGFDDDRYQMWGATLGPYVFVRE